MNIAKHLFRPTAFIILRLVRPMADFLWASLYNFQSRKLYLNSDIKKIEDKDLKRRGIKILAQNSDFSDWLRGQISDSLLSEERARMEKSENEYDFTTDLTPKLSKSARLNLVKFALSDSNIETAANYLGFIPRLATIFVMYNIPKGKPKGSMKWHRDTMVHKGINIFTCVTNVDPQNGIYSAVPLSSIPSNQVI